MMLDAPRFVGIKSQIPNPVSRIPYLTGNRQPSNRINPESQIL